MVNVTVTGGQDRTECLCGEALKVSAAPSEWRRALGERTGLRPDLPSPKVKATWVRRCNAAILRVVYTDGPASEVAYAGDLDIGLSVSNFARSVYDSTGSDGMGGRVYQEVTVKAGIVSRTTDRQATYTGLTLSEKASQACPDEGCGGWLHPTTWVCGRCKTQHPEGGEAGIRADVANRYEPKVKGMVHLSFNGDLAPTVSERTVTRRGGSDVAGLNPEMWRAMARWVSGENPSWRLQAFGIVALQGRVEDEDSGEWVNEDMTFLPVMFDAAQAAEAREWGITVQGRGPNMGIREAAL